MKLKEFDKVLLTSGLTAYIVEVYEHGKAYEADINMPDGSIKTDTIWPKDIQNML